MRLIDADALCAEIDKYVYPITTNNLMGAADAYFRIKHLIEQATTIEAEPVRHGQWLYEGYTGKEFCSNCGEIQECFEPRYCPNCGAKMDGGIDDG